MSVSLRNPLFAKSIQKPLRCSKEISSYRLEIQSDGTKKLVENDEKINVYERIQAKRPSSTTKEIYERCVRTGDMTPLNVMKAQYGDFSSVTGSLIDMQRTLDKAKETFANAPLEVRSKYNHDINLFLAAVDSGQIVNDFGSGQRQQSIPITPVQPMPVQSQTAPVQPIPVQSQTAPVQPIPVQSQTAPVQPMPVQSQTAPANSGGINYGY